MTDRELVLQALLKVETSGGYSTITLNSVLGGECTNSQFVSRLFYGVIERQITLDYQISLYSKKSLRSIKPEVLCILRMGVYQLLFMDSVPNQVAVFESVALTKKEGVGFASGFVNAVLRNVSKAGICYPVSSDISKLSVEYSCPEWLAKSFVNSFGLTDTKTLLSASVGSKPIFARVNTTKISQQELLCVLKEQGVDCCAVEGFPNSITVTGAGDIRRFKAFSDGLFFVEDLSSQICADALGVKPEDRVLDLCAAPGGKSFAIAQAVKTGEVISCDIHKHRVELISAGAKRLGLECVKPLVNDATVFSDKLGLFDKVLCDVPCSGFGVIGRKPEIKYKSFESISSLPELQLEILTCAYNYLKSGGTLVYSTCTLLERENGKVVKKFLTTHSNISVQEERTILPSEYNSDGFYYCVLKKEDNE